MSTKKGSIIMDDSITKALNWRHAVKEFDPAKKLDPALLTAILDAGRLAPSADGYEPWKFLVIENTEVRQKIRAAAYGQPKVTEAPYLIVVTYRTDPDAAIEDILKRTAKVQNQKVEDLGALRDYYNGGMADKKAAGPTVAEEWFRRQTYIALGFMVETAALLGVDAGPMEGFNNVQVDEILGLAAKNLKSATLLTLGYRAVEPTRPKVRQTLEEVVEYVK